MAEPTDEDLQAAYTALSVEGATGFLFAAMIDMGLLKRMPPGQWCLIARPHGAMPLPPSLHDHLDQIVAGSG